MHHQISYTHISIKVVVGGASHPLMWSVGVKVTLRQATLTHIEVCSLTFTWNDTSAEFVRDKLLGGKGSLFEGRSWIQIFICDNIDIHGSFEDFINFE